MSFFVGFAFFELGVFCGFFAASLMQAARTGEIVITVKEDTDGTGKEYTFVISNFELIYNESEKYKDYSGAVTFVFAADKVDDTSGNKNGATTLTLDYDDGDDDFFYLVSLTQS